MLKKMLSVLSSFLLLRLSFGEIQYSYSLNYRDTRQQEDNNVERGA